MYIGEAQQCIIYEHLHHDTPLVCERTHKPQLHRVVVHTGNTVLNWITRQYEHRNTHEVLNLDEYVLLSLVEVLQEELRPRLNFIVAEVDDCLSAGHDHLLQPNDNEIWGSFLIEESLIEVVRCRYFSPTHIPRHQQQIDIVVLRELLLPELKFSLYVHRERIRSVGVGSK